MLVSGGFIGTSRRRMEDSASHSVANQARVQILQWDARGLGEELDALRASE